MSMIGKTLGMFTLEAQIGKGGMGEVYKAKDQKLGRDVAIKVLPEEFAQDTDRVARFQREAKLLASLNHPNIAAIYGLEESEGTHFLVLELIEGDTLADRLKRGAIPVEEALKLALQIAEALEAAHEKGVIHRDLKPANIKVTPDGKVKVLDFGLAKAFAGGQEDMNLSNSPTLSAAATQQGVILGTAAYMSPEQAKGKTVDKRTDVWAFGCVLFEMLSGRSVFAADDVSQTLARVLEREPNFSTLPPNLHPRIRLLLERCLKKEPKNRYHDIADARVDMQEVLADPSGVFAQTVTATKPRKKLRFGISWVVAALILGLIIAGTAVWYMKPSEPRQLMRFDYELPESQQFNDLRVNVLAVSPDGKQFVYSTTKGLYLRSLGEYIATPIMGTEARPINPFFSPDGKWIGYYSQAEEQLKKISISGGAPVTLCDSDVVRGAIWGSDGNIVYADLATGIMRVSANGGTPETLAELTGDYLVRPQILPDGKTLLFSQLTGDKSQIKAQSLESGEQKVLFDGDCAQYVPTGHIVYMMRNNLLAVPFDLGSLEVTGGSVPIIESIFREGSGYAPQFAFSDSGTLVYMSGGSWNAVKRTLVWVDHEGNEETLSVIPDAYEDPGISPDGARITYSIAGDGNSDIWIYDLARGTKTRLTFDEADDFLPIWTPDNKRIIFCSERTGRQSVFWKAADGTGKAEQIASVPDGWIWPRSLSRDGNTLFFGQIVTAAPSGYNIGMLPMEGDRTPKLLLQENYGEFNPQISPDGQWLAYQSNESGTDQDEVYVRPFPDVESGGRWQVSTKNGGIPLWSPDGKELFYRSPDGIMDVAIETDPTFQLGTPEVLFPDKYFGRWDIHPDGKRFLMIKPPTVAGSESTFAGPRQINIVLNWFEELKDWLPVE